MAEALDRTMLRWYVIYAKRAGEVIAELNLKRQGYEVYSPRLAQVLRCRGCWQERFVALFSRYLFLRLSKGSHALDPVRSKVGVAGVVRFGSSCATATDQLIRDLQEIADSQSGLHRLDIPALPEPGAKVIVANGPFDGFEGFFERESCDERVIVLLSLLGRNTRVHAPLESVLPGLSA